MAKKSLARCRNDACRMPSLGSWSDGDFVPSGHITAGSQISFKDDPKRGMVAIVQCTFCRTEHIVYRDGRRKKLQVDLYHPVRASVDESGAIIINEDEQPQRVLVPVEDTYEYDLPDEAG